MRKSTFVGALAIASICSVCATSAGAKPVLPPAHVFSFDRPTGDAAIVAEAMTTGLRMDAVALCDGVDGEMAAAGRICLASLVSDARADVARALRIDLAEQMERHLRAGD